MNASPDLMEAPLSLEEKVAQLHAEVKRLAAAVVPKLSFDREQAAAELSISVSSLYRLECRGLIKPVPNVSPKIYARAELERFLREGAES